MFNKIIGLHLSHLNDPHFKVVLQCMESLQVLIGLFEKKTFNFLDKIIP